MSARREANRDGNTADDGDTGSREPPLEYQSQARVLIDRRVAEMDAGRAEAAELTQFHWWAQSHSFDANWWLPILLRAAVCPAFEIKGRFSEVLAEAVEREPALAMTALVRLYERREGTWSDYDLLQNAPAVIAAAQRGADGGAAVLAREFTDLPARQGHFDVLERIDELLDPRHRTVNARTGEPQARSPASAATPARHNRP